MDFAKAIDIHVAWIKKLQEAISGGEKLDPTMVCKDNLCKLGEWIYGEGKAHQNLAAYEPLKIKHAQFHQCAGDVVRKVNAGDVQGALAMVDTGGVFITVSTDTISAILKMKRELGL